MSSTKTAVIDIGSNSVRIVIYEQTATGGHRIIDTSKLSARLGGQLDDKQCLKKEAVNKLLRAMQHFKAICMQHHTISIRAAATAALRRAANKSEIINLVKRQTGIEIELLSGQEEAQFCFFGMIHSMSVKDGFLIDIGGGSTELSLFRNRKLLKSVSIPIGCINAASFAMPEAANSLAGNELHEHICSLLMNSQWISANKNLPLIGVGGTIRTLANIHQSKTNYCFRVVHNYDLHLSDINQIYNGLISLPLEQKHKLVGLSTERADIITSGTAILLSCLKITDSQSICVCSTGLRDGLYKAESDQMTTKLPLYGSIANICALYSTETAAYRKQMSNMARYLFDTLAPLAKLPKEARSLLLAAAPLHRIGACIDFSQYSEHTFYLLIHAKLYGLTHREQLLTAAIAAYRSKNGARQQLARYSPILKDSDLSLVQQLGSLLRLTAALDQSRQQAIKQIKAELKDSKLTLYLKSTTSLELEYYETKQLNHEFRKVWNVYLQLHTTALRSDHAASTALLQPGQLQ